MRSSPGFRFFIISVLIVLMCIPMMFIADIVDARSNYIRETRTTVGQEWGGPQAISGPALIIPVEETVMVRERRVVIDPATGLQKLNAQDEPIYRFVDVQKTQTRAPVYLYPDVFEAEIQTRTEERARGIFTVPVFTAEAAMAFDFPIDAAADALVNDEVLLWDEAELQVSISSNRALRGVAELTSGADRFQMEPLAQEASRAGGFRAPLGDPRDQDGYALILGFNGAETLTLAPVGRTSQISLRSDWPDPSFRGAFLPDSREVSEEGFSAHWSIPHLARPLPQVSRENHAAAARAASFGVSFYQANDVYQKSYRAARYGILFIGLTFLTIFLIEGQVKRPAHPVQYILVGLAQATFFLLMLSLSEQLGFSIAYALSAAATITLLSAFAAMALRLGRRSLVLGLMLSLLYGVLYLILRSADYALLAGSILTFSAIAGTMYATRHQDWYGPERPEGTGFFRRKPVSPPTSVAVTPQS